jgi:hypothetical protein
VVPFWLSAAIVGGTVLLIGLIVLARGRSNLKSENLTPERTLGSLRRDAEMARSEAERLRTREGDDETRYGPQGPRSH